MIVRVTLEPAEKGGYTVYVPALPGCTFEGDTFEEAIRNIREGDELKPIKIPGVQVSDNEDRYLIRLGRHSGAESMTIEGYRSIKIMTGRGQRNRYENRATTFWLVSEARKPKIKEKLRPFGWAELVELSASLAEEYKEREKGWKEKTEAKRKTIQSERDLQKEQMLQMERKAAEDVERRKIEADNKQK